MNITKEKAVQLGDLYYKLNGLLRFDEEVNKCKDKTAIKVVLKLKSGEYNPEVNLTLTRDEIRAIIDKKITEVEKAIQE